MLAVRATAAAFWHRIFLSPYDLASVEVTVVAKRDYEPVGEGEQVAISEPVSVLIDKGFSLGPRLYVSRVIVRQSVFSWAQRTILVVIHLPIYRGIVGIPQVDPHKSVFLELRHKGCKGIGQEFQIVPRIFFRAFR